MTVPLRQNVADEVRAWLARRRISASRAAALLGTSPTYLYRRLNGETALDLDDLERLSAILSVPVTSFFPAQPASDVPTHEYGRSLRPVRAAVGNLAA